MIIQTQRLTIRSIDFKDSVQVYKYRSNPEINQYLSFVPESIEEVDQFIAKNPKEFNLPETWFQLAIVLKETSEVIGDIGVHFFGKENKQVALGYTLSNLHQNKGFATEALKNVIDFLFTNLNKHRIVLSIDPENKASIKLAKRLGFRKEGHFVKSLFFKNQWVDDVVFALLKEEWLKT
ncbi:GNAT family protein [Flavobacterium dauae]|uniref:GNAT family N-acetyltransferase n=1 Tax=Flavobacterium dauae TaxID=1563479 RepID=UPI00101B4372|nr:GNAT family protein [Flavobacterium dauae]WLD24372.1 GNAT family protein [Flavobacterium dauae]